MDNNIVYSLVCVKYLDYKEEQHYQWMVVNIADAKAATQLISDGISAKKLKINWRKRENTTQKDKDYSTQMTKSSK